MTTATTQAYKQTGTVMATPLEKALAANRWLDDRNATLNRQIGEALHALDQLASQTAALSNDYAAAEAAGRSMTKDIEGLQQRVDANKQQKEAIELAIRELQDELNEIARVLKQTDSLYKNFPVMGPAAVLILRTEGNKLVASCQQETNFPCDLLLAFKDVKVTGIEIASQAACFLVLKKEAWLPVDNNKWSCDWVKNIGGKLMTGSWHVLFCHLFVEEYDCKIDFLSPKITVRK